VLVDNAVCGPAKYPTGPMQCTHDAGRQGGDAGSLPAADGAAIPQVIPNLTLLPDQRTGNTTHTARGTYLYRCFLILINPLLRLGGSHCS
jgi:hypothetical protein